MGTVLYSLIKLTKQLTKQATPENQEFRAQPDSLGASFGVWDPRADSRIIHHGHRL